MQGPLWFIRTSGHLPLNKKFNWHNTLIKVFTVGMKRQLHIFLLFCLFATGALFGSADAVINALQIRAKQSHTDALLVIRQDKPVLKYHAGKEFPRIDCQEMARPLLALAFGFLFDERFVSSLDTPVSTFCPSWDDGVCTDTSLRALLIEEGESFYRLGEVVKAITGEEWHDYIQLKLFVPLGINNACWCVHHNGQVRLKLTAPELAKIGQLILHKGELGAKQLLSRCWVNHLYEPTGLLDPFMSMQWYLEYSDFATHWDQKLLYLYACKGVSSHVIQLLKALEGRVIHLGGLAIRGRLVHSWGHDIFSALGGQRGLEALFAEAHRHRVPLGYYSGGGVKSLVAWGTGGQQFIIMPQQNLIAIRQTAHHCSDSFEDLIELLSDYTRQVNCYVD